MTASTKTNDTAIREAIKQMNEDPAIGTKGLEQAFSVFSAVLEEVKQVNTARNAAIDAWARKLRDLGMPDRGYMVDGQEVKIYTTATSGPHLSIGPVSALEDLAPYVVAATASVVGNKYAHARPIDTLGILDGRAG